MRDELRLRGEVIEVCRRLHGSGFIAATDGNVSCRLGMEAILITPGSKPKGSLKPVDLLVVDLQGEVIGGGGGKPSSEIRVHLEILRRRPDVGAVVHAHPPLLTALTVAGLPFMADLLPEVWLSIGPVPTAPYATPSTEELPKSIVGRIENHQAVLLERHGSLTLGSSPQEAYLRLEKLEHAAKVQVIAHLLGGSLPAPLSGAALAGLNALQQRNQVPPVPSSQPSRDPATASGSSHPPPRCPPGKPARD